MGTADTMQGRKGLRRAPFRCTWLLSAGRASLLATNPTTKIHPNKAYRGLESSAVTWDPYGPGISPEIGPLICKCRL